MGKSLLNENYHSNLESLYLQNEPWQTSVVHTVMCSLSFRQVHKFVRLQGKQKPLKDRPKDYNNKKLFDYYYNLDYNTFLYHLT